MMDDYYLKDICEVYPWLKSPVLFVLLGERGKEAFPFLEKTKGGMGDAIQILQIADLEYRIQDLSVAFVDICSTEWRDDINKALEISIIPMLKTNSYAMRSTIIVNFLIDLDDGNSTNIDELSEHIYKHLVTHFEDSVDLYFYCFSAVKFAKDRVPGIKQEVISKIQKKSEHQKEGVRIVFLISDLNEDDVYSKNIARKYLAITLTTYFQAGYRINPDDPVFDIYTFATSHILLSRQDQTSDCFFLAMSCAPLELNRDLLKVFFKMRLTEYLIQYHAEDQGILKDIFSTMGDEKRVITEIFDNATPNYFNLVDYIAYNQSAFRNCDENLNNRTWLRRIYNTNHQEYFEKNGSVVFLERLNAVLGDNSNKLKEKFRHYIEIGRINPFRISNYEKIEGDLDGTTRTLEEEAEQTDFENCEKLIQTLDEKINMLEAEATQLHYDFYSWEDSISTVKRHILLENKMKNRFRRRIIKEWVGKKRMIAIQEGLVKYTHMERDCVLQMHEIAKECQRAAEKYINACKNTFSRLERASFSYQIDHFDEYYSLKTKETMEKYITDYEKKTLYTSFCKYMLDEKDGFSRYNADLEEFISGVFWRKAGIKKYLVEEILDRMRAAGQRNKEDDVFLQLYKSIVKSKNVDLRVITSNKTDNDACCIMGPSDNMFISFLKRHKHDDSRIQVMINEQLTTPVVLYYKRYILKNEIRI